MPPEKLQKNEKFTSKPEAIALCQGVPPVGGNRFSGFLGRTVMKLTGWSFEGELPQHHKMVIAVGPHTSNWDFFLGVAVLFALRIRIRFLGKHTIFIPVVRNILQWLGGIPVDRRSSHGVVGQVVDAFQRSKSMILALSPEGTRSPIFPWKSGFLNIAHKAHVPVVLIGFDFAKKNIVFGPSLKTSGDLEKDMAQVYAFYANVSAKYPENAILTERK
jgi:hypothetical protein